MFGSFRTVRPSLFETIYGGVPVKEKVIRPLASGYSEAGASLIRRALRSFLPNSGPPEDDIDQNNQTLRERARMLYMSAPLATSAINTNRTHIVGPGLTLQSAIDRETLGLDEEAAKVWQHKAEAEFRLWAETAWNCDALGLNNFDDLQQLALKSWLMSGDVFAVIRHVDPTPLNPYGLRIQLVEADRVCNPGETAIGSFSSVMTIPEGKIGAGNKVYSGVEVDGRGQVVAYHICSGYPHHAAFRIDEKLTWTRVLARGQRTGLPNILQIMECERAGQYRGVPYLAPVIEPLLQLRRYTESELMAALIQSFFTAWIETETETSEIPVNEVGAGDVGGIPGENPSGISEDENEYEMGPGTVTHLKPGEKIVFGSPNIPTAGFETFVKTLSKIIGAGLEIPYDVLIKEFNASYSASRGALMEAWEAFKMRRHWFVADFCQPIYEIWLAEAVALGRIAAPGFFADPMLRKAWCGANWIGPVQVALDPNREAQAAVTLTTYGFKTYQQSTRELGGGDWDQNVDRLRIANEKLKESGAKPEQNQTSGYEEDEDDETD